MEVLKKSQFKNIETEKAVKMQVREILNDIKLNRDIGVRKYNFQFDKNPRLRYRVTRDEIVKAYKQVDIKFIEDIKIAVKNIEEFAKAQKDCFENNFEREIYPGVILGQKHIPIESALAYVPGGGYPLFSTALMLIIPAKIAGVKRVCACSPTMRNSKDINPKTLIAMDIAGADEIYAVGGVQAIGAFTYGTQSIKPVDIIVGPGNKYVTEAKRQCYGNVGIDFVAGPSEVLIIADETANADYIAADVLAQCEHDYSARGILITTDKKLGEVVSKKVDEILKDLPTRDIAVSSWRNNGEIIYVDTLEEAIKLSNKYAPEHLEISLKNEDEIIDKLINYGSLFVGSLSAEVFGDYVSGTNHTLPTLRASRYTGGVWVGTFIKTCTTQRLSQKAVDLLAPVAHDLAVEEGLYAHANAAKIRIK
ncbi:MAG TPA: histidinol dehydrogenase [Terrisporobacter glycolicus]|uniref:histidinol dehydrogenase n=1 Tax=Terrisporobacter hibernicus TaxID=2813371 RepID=UPI000E976387|nr:histidinol dehydrogenase [Terrisporobacter hibernicus]HBI91437.1 histidinol dehydrogenase [Terrisporobacter hibernicus]